MAGLAEKAVAQWLKAGQRSLKRSANLEAIAHLKQGLDLVRNHAAINNRAEHELMLLNTMATPLMNTKGYAAPEAVELYDRAYELASKLETVSTFFRRWLASRPITWCKGNVAMR